MTDWPMIALGLILLTAGSLGFFIMLKTRNVKAIKLSSDAGEEHGPDPVMVFRVISTGAVYCLSSHKMNRLKKPMLSLTGTCNDNWKNIKYTDDLQEMEELTELRTGTTELGRYNLPTSGTIIEVISRFYI